MLKIKEDIFKYYFYFMQERMNIFWNRISANNHQLTTDPIFKTYRFTNVYRASDRVSQYLIKNVIYSDSNNFSDRDILFRILFFKIFNKIETWEYLETKLGSITIVNFDLDVINKILSEKILKSPIFNNAYMMTGTHRKYNHLTFKHEKWLQMVQDEFIGNMIGDRILKAKTLEEIYNILRNCSFLGNFLAYQYTIDFNYSPMINFDENTFVKAGIGAIRGIKKCFENLGPNSYEDAIRFTQDNLEKYQRKFGFNNFKNLFGREPTLIDLQNCFCETDKYLRAKIPELQIDNKRIKQKFIENGKPLKLFFPPKWELNNKAENACLVPSTKALTLF